MARHGLDRAAGYPAMERLYDSRERRRSKTAVREAVSTRYAESTYRIELQHSKPTIYPRRSRSVSSNANSPNANSPNAHSLIASSLIAILPNNLPPIVDSSNAILLLDYFAEFR